MLLNYMKYGKLLIEIIENQKIKKNYINYNFLKKKIMCNNFIIILDKEINDFDNNYKNIKLDNNSYDLYCNLLINYLSINKILKKFKRRNIDAYLLFLNKYISISNFISKYDFYTDIINIPTVFNNKTDNICPICLEKCNLPITTDCNHTYCWECLLKTNKNFDFCPYCKKNTNIDPVIIVLNTIIDCDKKYSPLNILHKQKIDIVSDLHIDQWSSKYTSKYPCGKVSEFPFQLKKSDSDYLVVAGDISDNLDDSIKYLNYLSKYYNKILFVDGNHEHVNRYPKLYDKGYINKLVNNDKLVYLPKNPYRINNTMFIGCCGWWDYNNESSESIKKCSNYFGNWITHFSRKENLEFIHNVIEKSKEEFNYLNKLLKRYNNDNEIDDIVIVTHTLPDVIYSDNNSIVDNYDCQYNTKFQNLFKYNKLSKWIFGHTHKQWEGKINGVNIICNPRGRPEDYNRENYVIKQLEI